MATASAPRMRFASSLGAAVSLLLAATSIPAAAFDGYGEWRGKVQYLVSKHGEPSPVVQEIVPLVLRVDTDGKVVGASTENGCRLLGMVSPAGNNVMRLDATLRDCESKDLNRRISGTLAHYPADRRLALNVSNLDSSAKPFTRYEVTAPMMRR